ncbi:hypothetical protein LIA77_03517 [Sarocladium implicatum]|nr:hypothetical protein LIA77_03517 [Sarocladium implicatum]
MLRTHFRSDPKGPLTLNWDGLAPEENHSSFWSSTRNITAALSSVTNLSYSPLISDLPFPDPNPAAEISSRLRHILSHNGSPRLRTSRVRHELYFEDSSKGKRNKGSKSARAAYGNLRHIVVVQGPGQSFTLSRRLYQTHLESRARCESFNIEASRGKVEQSDIMHYENEVPIFKRALWPRGFLRRYTVEYIPVIPRFLHSSLATPAAFQWFMVSMR